MNEPRGSEVPEQTLLGIQPQPTVVTSQYFLSDSTSPSKMLAAVSLPAAIKLKGLSQTQKRTQKDHRVKNKCVMSSANASFPFKPQLKILLMKTV